LKQKDYYRMWGPSSQSNSDPYEAGPYYQSVKYFDMNGRANAIDIAWEEFRERRPACAQLLEILFGEDAKEAHLNVTGISETKARLVVEVIKTTKLRPSGDAFKITKM
jgi:hypothetical protein